MTVYIPVWVALFMGFPCEYGQGIELFIPGRDCT